MPDSTNSFTPPRLSLRALLSLPSISALVLLSLISSSQTQAYVPAVPINDTSALNVSDSSQIGISWTAPYGVYGGRVSYQLQADIPTGGHSAGALVHFTEGMMGPEVSTTTPWIAYISCDVNETGASMESDIFTLARDRGAVSAVSDFRRKGSGGQCGCSGTTRLTAVAIHGDESNVPAESRVHYRVRETTGRLCDEDRPGCPVSSETKRKVCQLLTAG